jgi:hypothetical protein
MAPPTSLGESPAAFIALMRPMESLIYEQKNRTSGSSRFRSSMYGVKSVVESGYLPSKITRIPCRARFSLAPSVGLCEKGASATRMATASGFGRCCPAIRKKPSVKARCGCGDELGVRLIVEADELHRPAEELAVCCESARERQTISDSEWRSVHDLFG